MRRTLQMLLVALTLVFVPTASRLPFLAGLVLAATSGALIPRSAAPLPAVLGGYASDVAWENADHVLIAAENGVHRYSLRTRVAEDLIPDTPLPDGLQDPEKVSSDGASVTATSRYTVGGYAMRLSDRKRLSAMRVPMVPLDTSVRGQRQCLLAVPLSGKLDEVVWCGPADKSWLKYQPVHRLTSNAEAFTRSFSPAGAIALGEDGSLTVVTSVEPGVFRYAADGTLIETLGKSFDDFLLQTTLEISRRFANDVDGRYHLLLNKQPLLEDLVLTHKGPALLVRLAEKERIRWELWWPRPEGKPALPATRLGIDRIGPFGHLRCDARGRSLACVGSNPDRKKAADVRAAEHVPYLWIFELPK
ncbi:MAG TPA: hypothetical protein VEO54_19725 [Thermoanaerobaculia bacterium]|nr:hypothetical protein [Thermoanaerobaculia bacterium]